MGDLADRLANLPADVRERLEAENEALKRERDCWHFIATHSLLTRFKRRQKKLVARWAPRGEEYVKAMVARYESDRLADLKRRVREGA